MPFLNAGLHTITKAFEISVAVRIAFKDFNFVAAFSKAVGDGRRKWIKNTCQPISHKLRNITVKCRINPIEHSNFGIIPAVAIKSFKKIFFEKSSIIEVIVEANITYKNKNKKGRAYLKKSVKIELLKNPETEDQIFLQTFYKISLNCKTLK